MILFPTNSIIGLQVDDNDNFIEKILDYNSLGYVSLSGNQTVSGLKTFVNNTTYLGNVSIGGDLSVTGTTYHADVISISGHHITLNSTVTGTPTLDAHIHVERGIEEPAVLEWSEDLDYWVAGVEPTPEKIILQSDLDSAVATYSGYADTAFVNISGDTMTGFLTLHSDPVQDMHAATKRYVDASLSGATFSGSTSFEGDVSISGDTIFLGNIDIKGYTGYSGSEFKILTGAITTTDNTATTVLEMPLPSGSVAWFEVTTLGNRRRTEGLAIKFDKTEYVAYNDSTTPTQVGAASATFTRNAGTGSTGYGTTISYTASGTVKVSVDGAVGHTVDWVATCRYQKVFNNT